MGLRIRILALPFIALALAGTMASGVRAQSPAATPGVPHLPDHLTDAEFWQLVGRLSEPDGYFPMEDNFTSNEPEIRQILPMLRDARVNGGVYIGVGPEQNFSYIATTHPQMAFICDIRRQAVVQHLMFKALFEMASDRAEFISLLFSIPRPRGLDSATGVTEIWRQFLLVPHDSTAEAHTFARIVERLTVLHGFTLNSAEFAQLSAVFAAFQRFGPGITAPGPPAGFDAGNFISLTSGFVAHEPMTFLGTEANYRFVKTMHEKNLIVPVSGDFAGQKALRGIGAYVRDNGATVRTFYISNVEQYLFEDYRQVPFYANVASLPVDEQSVFIRPYTMRVTEGRTLCPIASFLREVGMGLVHTNGDALRCVGKELPRRSDHPE